MQSAFPLRFSQRSDFVLVREFLKTSGFTEEFILSHFELPSLNAVLLARGLLGDHIRERYQGPGIPLLLARLLMGGYTAKPEELLAIPKAVRDAMGALGLLNERRRCPVLVYPALGFFMASDRGVDDEGNGYEGLDYVMSGTEEICRQYVASIGRSPCRSFLDIGTGSGLAALVATTFSEQVCALDITKRAAQFAEFNKLLNGADNMTVMCGDLFVPVAGMKFDRIACNPPFEPPLKKGMIFSVGGADGEAIMARLISESPAYLEPGGRLYCQVAGTDREAEPFESRIVTWLGSHAAECDVSLFVRLNMSPDEYAIEQILGENSNASRLEEWREFYRNLRARRVIIGHLIVERHRQPGEPLRCRLTLGPGASVEDMDRAVSNGRPSLTEPLHAGANWHLRVKHVPDAKGLRPVQYAFETAQPFAERLDVPSWAARIASGANGVVTAGEHFQNARWRTTPAEFERLLRTLLARRIVEYEPAYTATLSPLDVSFEESSAWFPDNNPNRTDLLSQAEYGEESLFRSFSDAAAALRPGGLVRLLFMGWDRAGIAMEDRMRATVFNVDAGLFIEKTLPPKVYARGKVMAENADSWKMQEWGALCQRLHVHQIVIGQLVLQRPASEREVFTIRRALGPATDEEDMIALMRWEAKCLEPGFASALMNTRITPNRGWELYARHAMKDGELVAVGHTLCSRYPFDTNLHCALWLVLVAGKADGVMTGGQLYEWLQTKARVPEAIFVKGVAALASAGILRTELHSRQNQ